MRLFVLVSKLYPWVGGTETQTETILKELSKRGHKVTVLTRLFLGRHRQRDFGVEVRRLNVYKYPAMFHYVAHVIKFLREIRKDRKGIDVLFCMQLTPNGLVGVLAKKLFGIPVVSYVRGNDWYLSKNQFLGRRIISYVLRNSDIVLTQTDGIRKDILGEFPSTAMKTIPNGISPYMGKPAGSRVIYVGNLFERKGIPYMIKAFEGLDEELLIAGNGPLEDELGKTGHPNIKLVGHIPKEGVRDFMARNGKILVLPAIKGEGLPNVILEAMSVGLPVIATRIAGIPDVVKDGKTGILVEPRDADGLRKAIVKLSGNRKLRKEMGKNALKEIEKYYWKNVISQLEEVLAQHSRKII
jgi:glycosyltransferase involved in cell wall biosynthesis